MGFHRVLAHRPFRVVFFGLILSNTGLWFQNLAAALLIYKLTHSSLQVGVVNFAQFVGTLVLTPWSGVAADRFDRRRILVLTQVLAAAATLGLGLLTLAGTVAPAMVIAVASLVGVSLAFRTPAQLALISGLVPPGDLEIGLSLNSLASHLPRAIGPIAASLLVVHLGSVWAFTINSAAFILAAAVFTQIPQSPDRPAPPAPHPRLLDTVRQVRSRHLLWAVLVATVAFSVAADPAYTLTPEFGTDIFGGSELFIGILVGSFGAGAVIGALAGPWLMRGRSRALPAAMIIEAAGLGLFAVSWNGTVAVVALLVVGAGYQAAVTRSSATLQLSTAGDATGRVMALWALCLLGPRPLAALPDGLLGDLASPRLAAALFVLPALAGAWYVNRALARRGSGQTGPE